MSWAAFEQRQAHDLVWALEIAGLGTRITSTKLPAKALPKLPGNFVDAIALQHVTEVGGSLPLLGGRAEHTTCNVTLDAPVGSPLMAILNRASPFDAPHARIIGTIPHGSAPGTTFPIDRDPSVFGSFPRVLHHGREAFRADARGSEVGGADPYRIEMNTRAVYGTQPEQNIGAGLAQAVAPFLMGEMIAWRGQRAVLYVGVRLGSGRSELMEYMRGNLAGPPESIDGTRMRLSIVPRTAKLDQRVVGPLAPVGLIEGVHATGGDAAYVFEHAQRVEAGDLWRATVDADTPFGGQVLITVQGAAKLAAHSDFALDPGHPRYGRVQVRPAVPVDLTHLGTSIAPVGIFIDGGSPAAAIGAGVVSGAAVELRRAQVCEPGAPLAVYAWPADYITAINDGWVASGRDGINGAYLSVSVGVDGAGLHLIAEMTDPHPTRVEFIAWSGFYGLLPNDVPKVWTADGPEDHARAELCWYPISWAEPGETRNGRAPIDLPASERAAWRDWLRSVEVRRAHQRIDCHGPLPSAWHQEGEPGVYLNGPVPVPAGGTTALRIKYTDRAGKKKTHIARITACDPLGDGYFATWQQDDKFLVPSFGNWPGRDKVVIEPVIYTDLEPPGRAILRLLLSGGGNGTNGPYDSLAFGLNLAESDVDIDSFVSLTAPAPFNRCRVTLGGEDTAAQAIDSILLATSSAIVMVRSDVGHRVTLVRLGAPSVLRSQGPVTSPLDGAPPRTIWRDEVTNVLQLAINHGDGGFGDAQGSIEATHRASQAIYGERDTIEIEARGVSLPGLGAAEGIALAVGMVARIGAIAGFHRREWSREYGLMEAMRMTLGAVYALTDDDFLDYGAVEPGVEAVPVRLIALNLDAWSGKVTATFARFPINASGINASARIVEVINATTVRVDPSEFVAPIHPVTGEAFTAVEGFPPGSSCRLMAENAWGDAVVRTVVSADPANQHLEVSAPHGFPVGPFAGRVRPPARGAAGELHKSLAYFAGADGRFADDAPGVHWT